MGHLTQGVAGETLVIYDLLKQGIPAFLSMAGLRYDVVADIEGKLVRIQVKSTVQAPQYIFHVTGRNKKNYSPDEFDMVALVSLTDQIVGYLPAYQVLNRKLFRLTETTLGSLPLREAYDRQRSLQHTPVKPRKRLRNKGTQRRRTKKGTFSRDGKGNTDSSRHSELLLERAS